MSWFDENGDGDVYTTPGERAGNTGERVIGEPSGGAITNPHIEAAKAAGLSQDTINDFLARNPGDAHRLLSAYDNEHGPDDPAPAAAGGGFGSGAPAAISPFTKQFTAPTLEQATNSPGFQFRLGEGMKALQRSAAAKGTLLTGGTGKALNDYGQQAASAEYDKVYNRALGEYQQEFNIHRANEGDRFSSMRTNRMDDFGIFDSTRRFDFDSARANKLDDFGMWHTLDQDNWNRNFSLADLGVRAGGAAQNAGSNFAAGASDLITGAGNANAAATVGRANAWGGAINNGISTGTSLAMLRGGGRLGGDVGYGMRGDVLY